MFVWSMRFRKKMALWMMIGALFIIAVFVCWWMQPKETEKNGIVVNSVAEIVTYVESFGWEIDPTPCEEVEVIVPEDFDDVYENFNEIQLRQGFDLTQYKGELVKRTTFVLLNYPDQPDYMRVDVLTYENQVVGADVCSLQLRGFMHGINELEQPETVENDDLEAE